MTFFVLRMSSMNAGRHCEELCDVAIFLYDLDRINRIDIVKGKIEIYVNLVNPVKNYIRH